jgi:hypothetical protein
MAIYIEYISRRAGTPLEAFHQIARRGQEGWATAYPDDHLILNVGRTWRLGAEPEYLCVWDTPGSGVERLGGWHAIFETKEADPIEKPFEAVARIDVAGWYEPLREPVRGTGPLYYGEFFEFADGATSDDVSEAFTERVAANGLVLDLLCDRIGRLGPDPRGVAIWQLPGYDRIHGVAMELDDVVEPIQLLRCGLYADIGQEVL